MTTNLPDILYRGSVKNVRGNDRDDFVFFEFSDRYSIFDWGEMPDQIKNKGLSLARFTDAIYSCLEKNDLWSNWQIPSSYNTNVREYLSQSLAYKKLLDTGIQTHRYQGETRIENLWKVKKITVPKISNKKYEFYQTKPVSTLVPLEVIFRFGTPTGSSLLKRLEKNPDYMYSLGLEQMPKEMEWFDRPIIEFSTKLESSDRYIPYSEAKQIAGLSQNEFDLIYGYAALLAMRLKDVFKEMNLELWDGKFEFAFIEGQYERDFCLVDSMGPDEIRITYQNMHVSKEVLRQVYTSTDWYKKITEYKEKFEDWQHHMRQDGVVPPALPTDIKNSIEEMYVELANTLESCLIKNVSKASRLGEVLQNVKVSLKRTQI